MTKVVHKHQWWRLITCMWLHGGVFHLLANMLSLLVIGIRLEQEFGFGMYQYISFVSFLVFACTNDRYLFFSGNLSKDCESMIVSPSMVYWTIR